MNEQVVNMVLQLTKDYSEATKGLASSLIDEAVRLYLFIGILAVLKYAAIFVLYAIIRKYLLTLPKEHENVRKAGLTTILLVSLFSFVMFSYPHFEGIVKVLVAPKIFIATKGVELFKGMQK